MVIITKKIAVRTGLQKNIYPYLIKPSAITDGFNQQINFKFLQRQARHNKIESTLLYDHTTDEMTKEYFNKVLSKNIENLSSDEKTKMQLDESRSNEIDLKTFKTRMDVLMPDRRQKGDDVGYV